MKKNIIFAKCLLVICLVFSYYGVEAATTTAINTATTAVSVFDLSPVTLVNGSKAELEDAIGRKLTFKEKIALKLVKKKLKKHKELDPKVAFEQTKTDAMAVAGFVTGLVSLFIFGIILGILAIVFSSIALKRIKREPEALTGRGLAVAGLVLGIIGLVGALIVILTVT